jgi:hypothetical protein
MTNNECYLQDPFLRFTYDFPGLSCVEQKVLWTIERLGEISGRMSMADIARAAQVARRTVAKIADKFRGRGLTFIGAFGQTGIFRLDRDSLRGILPMHAVHRSPVHPVQGLPMHAAHTPEPPRVPALPEGDLKALRELRVNGNMGVKIAAAAKPKKHAPLSSDFLSADQERDVLEVVRMYWDLRGAQTNQPPGLPEADLCLRILSGLEVWGLENSGYLLLSHFHENRQAENIRMKNKNWDSLHHAFPWVVRDGRKIFSELNKDWALQRIENGRKIAEQQKKKQDERRKQVECRDGQEPACPEIRRRFLDQILGRTRKSAAM